MSLSKPDKHEDINNAFQLVDHAQHCILKRNLKRGKYFIQPNYHQTPLELLEKRMKTTGIIPRRLEEHKRSELLFMQTTQKRRVRGSMKSGRKPYIQFEGVEYRSERLANSAYLLMN
ncbi:hypothetical protein KQI74_06645 [Paenibacillus barcinonensis]|uniref:hypothetical protein n=1 Tax=Paenibacillus barcinonensis TaxID=198119 RepID=UPI001C0F4E56|nr:hypothetical protein [Paenibacillus barcinonensis]MBU5351949.1 hypothetical protein [Paenibacillus barcinonensis]